MRTIPRCVLGLVFLLAACGGSVGGDPGDLVRRGPPTEVVDPIASDDPPSVMDPLAPTGRLLGVNISGGEYGKLGDTLGYGYVFPSTKELDYFAGKGMNVIRMPVKWERLQPEAGGALDAAEVEAVAKVIRNARERGLSVILDPHNYGRYYGKRVGTEVDASVFADFWRRMTEAFKDEPAFIYGLMNEPYSMDAKIWASAAHDAVVAIREAGGTQLILIPGVSWTGAHSWISSGNAEAMETMSDPLDNFAFELHQYFDKDSSGTSATCVSGTIGAQRIEKVTAWMQEHGFRGLLGEFGSADNPTCQAALDGTLAAMERDSEQWLGWTYWAAGAWWGDYMYTLEPGKDGSDQPQMAVIEPYLD